ncbi:hypothetical protein MRB53_040590 [Persea americana]|nr:hypothetical protein MRB53_040590 [Persea americana]
MHTIAAWPSSNQETNCLLTITTMILYKPTADEISLASSEQSSNSVLMRPNFCRKSESAHNSRVNPLELTGGKASPHRGEFSAFLIVDIERVYQVLASPRCPLSPQTLHLDGYTAILLLDAQKGSPPEASLFCMMNRMALQPAQHCLRVSTLKKDTNLRILELHNSTDKDAALVCSLDESEHPAADRHEFGELQKRYLGLRSTLMVLVKQQRNSRREPDDKSRSQCQRPYHTWRSSSSTQGSSTQRTQSISVGRQHQHQSTGRKGEELPSSSDEHHLQRSFQCMRLARRWIVQEIALASSATIYCGDDSIQWRISLQQYHFLTRRLLRSCTSRCKAIQIMAIQTDSSTKSLP